MTSECGNPVSEMYRIQLQNASHKEGLCKLVPESLDLFRGSEIYRPWCLFKAKMSNVTTSTYHFENIFFPKRKPFIRKVLSYLSLKYLIALPNDDLDLPNLELGKLSYLKYYSKFKNFFCELWNKKKFGLYKENFKYFIYMFILLYILNLLKEYNSEMLCISKQAWVCFFLWS